METPEKFKNLAEAVRNEVYGKDVREAIATSIEKTGASSETAIKITEQLIDGSFDEAELTTEIERRLNQLEEEYAPELNSVKSQLAQTQKEKADKSELNAQVNNLNAELDRKATKQALGNISVDQINKSLGKLDETYMSEEFLQQMAGDTPVNSVPADESVTPEKTTFSRLSKNLYNKDTVVHDKSLDSAGELIDDDTRVVSAFIPVEGGSTVARSDMAVIVAYDENKDYLQRTGNSSQPYTTTQATRFIRLAISKSHYQHFQLEYGDESTSFEEFGKVIQKDLLVNQNNFDEKTSDVINNSRKQVIYNQTNKKHSYPNEIVDLLGSYADLTNVTNFNLVSANVIKDDSIAWKEQGHSWKIISDGTESSQVYFNLNNPIDISHSSAVGIWVYAEDLINMERLHVDLYTETDSSAYWTRNSDSENDFKWKKGWNLIRWDAVSGSTGTWEQVNRIRIRVSNTGPITVNVGSLFAEKNDKAKLIIVNDGARKSWLDIAYPELKERGFPTTWAINPNTFGSSEDKMSEEELLSLKYDLESSFSFHSWGSGTPTSQMTERETREDALRCIRYLKGNGLASEYLWRAAVHQNQAPHHRVNDDLLLASATYDGRTGLSSLAFPFTQPYNIQRGILHGDNPDYDRLFNTMKKIRGVSVVYTHGITDEETGSADMTTAQWNDFLSRIDVGISEGWLEGTTFEDLYGKIANAKQVNELDQLKIATRI